MISARHNPFAANRIQATDYIWQNLSYQQIETRLKELDYTASIVGPHGSGKTALLRHLEERLSQNRISTKMLFISLDVKVPWPAIKEAIYSIPPRGVLFFDGANHLPFLRFRQLRWTIRKQHIGLIITSHSEGLLPTLTQCQPQLTLLTELVERLLPNDETIAPLYLESLFKKHSGNLRDCLWKLYDEYAERNLCLHPDTPSTVTS